jgi:abequosyltransferase
LDNIALSICIPTKNFGPYIRATLDGILSQRMPELEVVIVDGGSTDQTKCIVEDLASKHSCIRYVRKEMASGVDRDLRTAIGMARGRYCWLMSADDAPKPGAMRRVLREIESGYDTYICNRTECDLGLSPLRERFWLRKTVGDRVVDFGKPDQIARYFKQSVSLGAVFSYISSVIFAREFWDDIEAEEGGRLEGSNYQHAFLLLKALSSGGCHKYIHEQLVYCRGGNDSFLQPGDQGVTRRYLIDLDGYLAIASALSYPPSVQRPFLRILRREHPWYMWIRVAVRLEQDEEWRAVARKLRGAGYRRSQLFLLSLIRRMERVLPVVEMTRRVRRLLRFVPN